MAERCTLLPGRVGAGGRILVWVPRMTAGQAMSLRGENKVRIAMIACTSTLLMCGLRRLRERDRRDPWKWC